MTKLLFLLIPFLVLTGCSSLQSYEATKNVPTAHVRVAVELVGTTTNAEYGRYVLAELMDSKCDNRYQLPRFIQNENRTKESLVSETSVINLIKILEEQKGGVASNYAERVHEFEIEAGKGHVFDFLYKEADRSTELHCGLRGETTFLPGENVEIRYRAIKHPNQSVSCELIAFNLLQVADAVVPISRPLNPVSCNAFIIR